MVYSCRLSNRMHGRREGESRVTNVIVESDEPFENALRQFKKQCEKVGLLSELKKHQHSEKPDIKRQALAARKKAKRRERFSD